MGKERGIYKDPPKRSLQPRNSSLSSFLSQVDSDDDENSFQPPALSDYALALLKKEQQEKESIPKANSNMNSGFPKKVNFIPSTDINKPESSNSNNNYNNTTNYTNLSEAETIFSKKANNLESYSSSPGMSHKTPLTENKRILNTQDANSSSSSQLRTKSIRRSRLFGSLGPPKRASFTSDFNEPSAAQQEKVSTSFYSPKKTELEDTPMKDAVSPSKYSRSPINSLRGTMVKQEQIHFENLNPYQYAKKHNIPSSELPNLIKLFFEQREENRESLQSPVRLKNAMYNQIQEEIRHGTPRRLSPRSSMKSIEERKSKSLDVYTDKENANNKPKNISTESKRQPLAQLQENRNHQIPATYKSEGYQELHYKTTEPIKEPDYQSMRHLSRIMTVNDKQYEKLELLGKGGSSKVFKVKSLKNKVYAIKKIVFDEFDDASIKGFKGEIDLLIKLRNQERVVRLIDYTLGQGSLLLVMECGDIDLSHVLSKRLDMSMDIEFVRYHANEMVKCVKAVHDAGIVHSDLKPANFLFVKGVLKIIDFGIANAVPEHTVNIYRESQIGTPNYMAPEALIDHNNEPGIENKSTWRVGKPSDIWSCGCIIYQMIYGRPPYGGYQGSQRLLAIMNPDVKIMYPEKGLGGVKVPGTALETIKNCLEREPSKRWDVNGILNGSFLKPRIVSENFINDLVKNAITYGISKNKIDNDELKNLADDVWRRVSQLSL